MRARFAILGFLATTISGCEGGSNAVLSAVQNENPDIIDLRVVRFAEGGSVCGEAINSVGQSDRFVGYQDTFETVINLESQVNAAAARFPELGADYAHLGSGFRRSFLQDYQGCMLSGA